MVRRKIMQSKTKDEFSKGKKKNASAIKKYLGVAFAAATMSLCSPSLEPVKSARAEDAGITAPAELDAGRQPNANHPLDERPDQQAPEERPERTNLDIGAEVFTTESGSSSFRVDLNYDEWLEVRTGLMWFPSNATEEIDFSPFGALQLRPSYQSPQGIILASYSSIAGAYNMNSYLFAAQTFGIGYERKSGEFVARGGVLWGGGIAYPNFDYIFSDLRVGFSLEWDEQLLAYGTMSFFFAGDSPAQTAYVGFYEPRFQNLMVGIEVRHDDWIFDFNGTYDVIRSEFNATIQRNLYFGDNTLGRFWGTIGFGKWDDELMSHAWELVVHAGVEIRFIGRPVESSNSIVFEHDHSGNVSQADMDIDNPNINRTNLEPWSRQVESDLMGATSLEDFSNRYSGMDVENLLDVARIMTHRANYLYANSAMEALMSMQFFDSEVQRIANMSHDDVLGYIGAYLGYYNNHGTLVGMPSYLEQGLGICTMIHDFGAEFLRQNGVHAITAAVNTPWGPHMVLIAMTPERTTLIDYGDEYDAGPQSFDETLRLYGLANGAPVLLTQIFDGQYRGTYITSEGRNVMHSLAFDNQERLEIDFLGRTVGSRR
jgi:hypothetical protein